MSLKQGGVSDLDSEIFLKSSAKNYLRRNKHRLFEATYRWLANRFVLLSTRNVIRTEVEWSQAYARSNFSCPVHL
jgi:hypothetical protein